MRTLGNISLAVGGKRARYLTNRGKYKGSAVVGIVSKFCGPSRKAVRVSKGRCAGVSATSTVTTNVRMVCRSFSVFPGLAMVRGLTFGRMLTRGGGFIGGGRFQGVTRRTIGGVGFSMSLSTEIRALPITSGRLVTVSETLLRGTGLVVVSRPAATLAGERMAHLFKVVRRLGGRNVAVLFISRGLSRMFRVSSDVAVLEDKRGMCRYPTDRVARRGFACCVAKEGVSASRMGRMGSFSGTRGILRIGSLSTGKFRRMDFSLRTKRVLKITKRLKSKHARLDLTLFKVLGPAKNDVYVSNGRIRLGGITRTRGRNVTLIPRSQLARKLFLPRPVCGGVTMADLGRLSNILKDIGRSTRGRLSRR